MLVLFPFNLFDLMYVSSQHLLPENGMKLRIQKRYTYTILYRAYNSQCFFFWVRRWKHVTKVLVVLRIMLNNQPMD